MIRSFIAIELSDEVRAAIGEAQARLRRGHYGVKVSWAKLENVHLTLQFLGYIDESSVGPLSAALDGVARAQPVFEVAVAGTGAFPDVRRPRVLWVGCADPEGRLAALATAVQAATGPLGIPPENRPFSAHLTLGRVKFPRPDPALTKALDSLTNAAFGKLRVSHLHLWESQLHPQGSIYTKLSTHGLGEPG